MKLEVDIMTESSLPQNRPNSKSVFFLSGIGTWQSGNMFGPAMADIAERYTVAGYRSVFIRDLYPYGTLDGIPQHRLRNFLVSQIVKVNRDLFANHRANEGGRFVYREILRNLESDRSGIVLIGHSGGGIAAYKAARLLEDDGISVEKVIMVGSPVPVVARNWEERVRFLRKAGRFGDWITLLGKPRLRTLPDEEVRIVGGHTHYFCPVKVDADGISNLTKVMDRIWNWVRPQEEVSPPLS
jgi:pimeloyl-ACP methyl ester carboxylesterase